MVEKGILGKGSCWHKAAEARMSVRLWGAGGSMWLEF